jgi:hypothetical protein
MIKGKVEDFDLVENGMFICHEMTIILIVSATLLLYDWHRNKCICMSIRMYQLHNCYTDADEILYKQDAIGIHLRLLGFSLLQNI